MAWGLGELRRRTRNDPSGRYLLALAEELLRRGEAGEALATLDRRLQDHPGHIAARVAKGRCLVDLGRSHEALALFDQVLSEDPVQMVAAKLRVEAAIRTGDAARASRALESYLELQPGDPAARALRSRIDALEGGRRPEADRDDRDRARRRSREDELVTATLGNLYLEQGHRRQAEEIFRRILRSDPDNEAARAGLARVVARSTDGASTERRRHDIVRASAESEGDPRGTHASAEGDRRDPAEAGSGAGEDREKATC